MLASFDSVLEGLGCIGVVCLSLVLKWNIIIVPKRQLLMNEWISHESHPPLVETRWKGLQ
jgi:hypothetical protein